MQHKFKNGAYTGERYSDGSIRIWKNKCLVAEIYIPCKKMRGKLKEFGASEFASLTRCIEKNCKPYTEADG